MITVEIDSNRFNLITTPWGLSRFLVVFLATGTRCHLQQLLDFWCGACGMGLGERTASINGKSTLNPTVILKSITHISLQFFTSEFLFLDLLFYIYKEISFLPELSFVEKVTNEYIFHNNLA